MELPIKRADNILYEIEEGVLINIKLKPGNRKIWIVQHFIEYDYMGSVPTSLVKEKEFTSFKKAMQYFVKHIGDD